MCSMLWHRLGIFTGISLIIGVVNLLKLKTKTTYVLIAFKFIEILLTINLLPRIKNI